ncbi:DUF2510 domain-containing protein [Leucobacter luti]|uniref:Uncharacterized protein DUF2510 n=1 Tax=Leucobacter luti TaxID=340320 RepID=A0A4Q7TVT1_9MICO|nr:DUF2510 domain-containing protein [Leucobacter luti]MBL3698093.1 DUF2510 domain-containing protein [Leucobacter luti]RZT64823.1 uncharacterized protein DUF2510 [Leucobacter luti]
MQTPAGWYADPEGSTRYWDGAEWTSHVAPATQPGPAQQHTAQQHAVQQYPVQQYAVPQYPVQQVFTAPSPQHHYTVAPASNGAGVAGFVVGLVSVFLPLFFGLAVGITGLVLSIVGIARGTATGRARGLSIAGLVLSCVGIIFIL